MVGWLDAPSQRSSAVRISSVLGQELLDGGGRWLIFKCANAHSPLDTIFFILPQAVREEIAIEAQPLSICPSTVYKTLATTAAQARHRQLATGTVVSDVMLTVKTAPDCRNSRIQRHIVRQGLGP